MSNEIHSPAGLLLTQLILEVFRANGRLLAVGDDLTSDLGLTSSRWQILGAIVQAQSPLTVPSIARNMGLQRQSVQRTIDLLHAEGLLAFENNPHHLKAKLVTLTKQGIAVYKKVAAIQTSWANEISTGFDLEELDTAIRILRSLRDKLKEE